MKKSLYLGILLTIGSCATNESEIPAPTVKEETKSVEAMQEEKPSISTIKIGRLEVMTKDLGVMEWPQAEQACENLENGWRLPSLEELEILHNHRKEIGGFEEDHYWSSTESKDPQILNEMMIIRFGVGNQFYNGKQTPNHVRAVRDLQLNL
jgi:hypothetical protein